MTRPSPEPTAEEIRRQMRLTRRRVHVEAGKVVAGARRLADWRFYPRQFPWLTVGGAALLAFAAVPRRAPTDSPDVAEFRNLKQLDCKRQHVFNPQGSAPVQKGVVAGLLATASTLALRYAISYAARYVGRRLNAALVRQPMQERMA